MARPKVSILMLERFGTLPAWADELIAHMSEPQLEALGLRLLKAQTIEELLQ